MAMRGAKPAPEPVAAVPQEAPRPDPHKKADEERLAREKVEQEAKAKKLAEEENLVRAKAEQQALLEQQKKQARPEIPKPKPAAKPEPRPEPRPEPKPEPAPPPVGEAAAFAHYRALALKGDADAALRVGDLYDAGRGTTANPNWAYVWYSVAESRGVAAAKAKKEALAGRLQAKEIEQADKLARSLMQSGR
jgi:TPR repeat protein